MSWLKQYWPWVVAAIVVILYLNYKGSVTLNPTA
jgi:hypothetical protein